MGEDAALARERGKDRHHVTARGREIDIHPNAEGVERRSGQSFGEEARVELHIVDPPELADVALHFFERAGEITFLVSPRIGWREALERVEDVEAYSELMASETQACGAEALETAELQ